MLTVLLFHVLIEQSTWEST